VRDPRALWEALECRLTVEEGASLLLHAFRTSPSRAVRVIDGLDLHLLYMRRIPGPTVKYSAEREVSMAINELVEIIASGVAQAEHGARESATDHPIGPDLRARTRTRFLASSRDVAEKIFDAAWPAPGPGAS
jgi:hypothetical protein